MKRIILWLLGVAYELVKRTPLLRLEFAKRLYYGIYRCIRPEQVSEVFVFGHTFRIDPRDQGVVSFLLTRRCYEPYEVSLVQRLLHSGDCFVDIGANFGYYTVIAAYEVGESGHVLAFEPEPHNFELLQRNVTCNEYGDRVAMHQVAIGAESGSGELFLNSDNLGDHQILDCAPSDRQAVEITVRSLDEVLDERQTIALLKMDIQGAEMLAWLGMGRLLDRQPNVIILTEFCPTGLRRCGHDPSDFTEKILEQNFVVYLVDEQRRRLRKLSPTDLAKRCDHNQQCNLLLVRGSQVQEVDELQ